MSGYLIYHPRRAFSRLGNVGVYHDHIGGNQDPYIWNVQFLHTYCHITQMRPNIGDINFWVSGNTFPDFSCLNCDLVFVVEDKFYWQDANVITQDDVLVDTPEAFNDHYRWAMFQHQFKRRRRYTLKANAERSFQPQNHQGELLDIIPFLLEQGYSIEALRAGMRSGFNSKPLQLQSLTFELYNWIENSAVIKLYGQGLYDLRCQHQYLASP